MKSNKEIRLESLSRALTGKWFLRMLAVALVLNFVQNTVNSMLGLFYKRCEIQTWFDYLQVKVQALREGIECSVPSRALLVQMNYSSAFTLFMGFVFGGIVLFGMTAIFLKSAKADERNWFKASLGGFGRPLGVAWLGFVLAVRIALWSLLFVVPGIVASYRYSQSWNLKVENPEWSAARCISESVKIMDGHKWQRFMMDVYFCVISLFVFSLVALASLTQGVLSALIALIVSPICFLMYAWWSVAKATFYTELKQDLSVSKQDEESVKES